MIVRTKILTLIGVAVLALLPVVLIAGVAASRRMADMRDPDVANFIKF